MTSTVTLRRGSQSDIPFIMATERLEGYGELVGRWEADRHLAALGDGRHAYFIADGERRAGRLRDPARLGLGRAGDAGQARRHRTAGSRVLARR